MPKIKFKNIPATSRIRFCYKSYSCQQCPFDMEGSDTGCMITSKHNSEEVVVELSEKDFPTNREWMGSLSNEDLAAFYTHGVLIERYSQYPVNLHQIVGSFSASELGIAEWFSKPCIYLMEVNTDAED